MLTILRNIAIAALGVFILVSHESCLPREWYTKTNNTAMLFRPKTKGTAIISAYILHWLSTLKLHSFIFPWTTVAQTVQYYKLNNSFWVDFDIIVCTAPLENRDGNYQGKLRKKRRGQRARPNWDSNDVCLMVPALPGSGSRKCLFTGIQTRDRQVDSIRKIES